MQLKEHQEQALDSLKSWLQALEEARIESEGRVKALEGQGHEPSSTDTNYPDMAWKALADQGELPRTDSVHVDRTDGAGRPIPHVCFKVPTGGGKTLLAAASLERLHRQTGLVLWIIPTRAIYEQTKSALWDREHPYRQMLERASGGRLKLLEKEDLFTAGDVENYLCVMLLMLPAANQNPSKDFLRMFRDSGRYPSFFPDSDVVFGANKMLECYPDLERTSDEGPVKESLYNVFKMLRPIVILDEAHKAYGKQKSKATEFVQSVSRLNPRLVIELSATPHSQISNLLVDIGGPALHREEMIKLPVQVSAAQNMEWTDALNQAHDEMERLAAEASDLHENEHRYIRPIAVVRVERTGKDQQDGDHIHAEDVRQHLLKLGVGESEIAVQSAEQKDLDGVDLLNDMTPIRWIITKAALMEGWDCPFAYVLVMLDNTQAQRAITQLVGRVMRQPEAARTGREALDQCYVHCVNTEVGVAVDRVKKGLEQEGLTGLGNLVDGGAETKHIEVKRRSHLADRDIFLPMVLHADGKGWTELSYQRHIEPEIDWDKIGSPDVQRRQAAGPVTHRVVVQLDERGMTPTYDHSREVWVDKTLQLSWYARRLADIVPNPWQAARIVEELMDRLRAEGQSESDIYDQRTHLAWVLREHVIREIDQQSEWTFKRKLSDGDIKFSLETNMSHRLRAEPYTIVVPEEDHRLERKDLEPLQLSLFEPQMESQFDTKLERNFARFLDEQKALEWWHRVGVRQRGEYFLRGWKRNRIWPDFVAMASDQNGERRIYVFETKGEHLEGSQDTAYKQRVLEALEGAFNGQAVGQVKINDGPVAGSFLLVFEKNCFSDAKQAIADATG